MCPPERRLALRLPVRFFIAAGEGVRRAVSSGCIFEKEFSAKKMVISQRALDDCNDALFTGCRALPGGACPEREHQPSSPIAASQGENLTQSEFCNPDVACQSISKSVGRRFFNICLTYGDVSGGFQRKREFVCILYFCLG